MRSNQTDWDEWAQYLQQKNLLGIARFVLDAAGPFRILAAQSLLLSKPFVNIPFIENFAKILEDEQATKDFNKFLSEKGHNE
jgi:hypothetical protein